MSKSEVRQRETTVPIGERERSLSYDHILMWSKSWNLMYNFVNGKLLRAVLTGNAIGPGDCDSHYQQLVDLLTTEYGKPERVIPVESPGDKQVSETACPISPPEVVWGNEDTIIRLYHARQRSQNHFIVSFTSRDLASEADKTQSE